MKPFKWTQEKIGEWRYQSSIINAAEEAEFLDLGIKTRIGPTLKDLLLDLFLHSRREGREAMEAFQEWFAELQRDDPASAKAIALHWLGLPTRSHRGDAFSQTNTTLYEEIMHDEEPERVEEHMLLLNIFEQCVEKEHWLNPKIFFLAAEVSHRGERLMREMLRGRIDSDFVKNKMEQVTTYTGCRRMSELLQPNPKTDLLSDEEKIELAGAILAQATQIRTRAQMIPVGGRWRWRREAEERAEMFEKAYADTVGKVIASIERHGIGPIKAIFDKAVEHLNRAENVYSVRRSYGSLEGIAEHFYPIQENLVKPMKPMLVDPASMGIPLLQQLFRRSRSVAPAVGTTQPEQVTLVR